MIVCVCHRISHRDIEHQARACDSFDELQLETGVATHCGRCGECARAVFDDARQPALCATGRGGRSIQISAALA